MQAYIKTPLALLFLAIFILALARAVRQINSIPEYKYNSKKYKKVIHEGVIFTTQSYIERDI